MSDDSHTALQVEKLKQSLFTLTDWRQVGGRKWEINSKGMYAANSTRSPNSYLISPSQFDNFQLSLEWKTVGRTGQGGVFFRYDGKDEIRNNAYKIQLSNDFGVLPDQFSTGALFSVEAPEVNAVKSNDEWNQLQLTVKKERVIVKINGTEVLNTNASSETIPLRGHVVLDGVVGGITYRKILLIPILEANSDSES